MIQKLKDFQTPIDLIDFFRRLHRSEQYTTSSQHFFHALRHSKGLWQTGHILAGRWVLLKPPLVQDVCQSQSQLSRSSLPQSET